ncbi:pilus assembly protein PilW [Luteimonas yindakuii]|nr:pilus assembly protein PilW [Luteimonas yindakuii]
MVALLIGTLLVMGLVQVFSASRTAYQLSSGLARAQENGRFAMDMLQRDLRVAGHMGCVNDQARFLPENITPSRPALVSTFLSAADQFNGNFGAVGVSALRFDQMVQGFDANGTASGQTLTLAATPAVAPDGSSWTPALPADVRAAMIRPVSGSDVLILRHFAPAGAQVTSFTPGVPATIQFNTGHLARLTEGVTSPRLLGIGDCMTAAVFEAAGDLDTGTITVATGGVSQRSLTDQPFVTGQAMLYRAESLVYYVGVNEQGVPSLYRTRFGLNGIGALTTANEELVEGIESMQLQYGVDSEIGLLARPTGNIGRSHVASAPIFTGGSPVANADVWRRVGLVQVGLVARSAEPAAVDQRSTSDNTGVAPLSIVGVRVTPPGDRFYRTVYEDSVALRNRLFGN